MRRIIFLDSGPLGMVCHNLGNAEALAVWGWMWNEATCGSEIIIPDMTDYEIRRSLLKNGLTASLARLDRLPGNPCARLPITTPAIQRAASLWAQARHRGQPTSGESSIDGDVILAAQALEYCSEADDWWVATENERHLTRYLGNRARSWRTVPAAREKI